MIHRLSLIFRFLVLLTGINFVFDIPSSYMGLALWREQIGLIMLGLVAADIFIVYTWKRHNRREQNLVLSWPDLLLAVISLAVFGYATWNYEDLISYGYLDNQAGILISVLAVFIIAEVTRRTSGWPLLIVLIVFLVYAVSANLLPGMLQGRDISLYETFNYVVLDPSGLLGTPLAVVTTTVLAFVIFGSALFTLGGGKMFLDLAIASMRGIRGGTAKSSIMASSLFGSISGSAVGNVVTTGIVTIPLMKRSGYKSHEAGAIEAVASTGGQLMPPIMGSAAFIMADILSIPYQSIIKAALIPGILFYLTLFMQVHYRARLGNVQALQESDTPSLKATMRNYWPFVIPIILLLYLLFYSTLQPQKTALISAGICIIAALFSPIRPGIKKLLEIIDTTGMGMASIMPAVAVAGIIIGVLSITGLGFNFGMGVVEQSGGNLFLLLVLTALAALVLGMGLPTTAVYILMASLVAPALVSAGIAELPAHLFVLYFGVLSMITPPICLASIAAASIADSNFIQTGIESVKLGIAGFFVPFIFVLNPELLSLSILKPVYWLNLSCVVVGFILLAGVIEGYLFRRLLGYERILLLIGMTGLFTTYSSLTWQIVSLAVALLICVWIIRTEKKLIEQS